MIFHPGWCHERAGTSVRRRARRPRGRSTPPSTR